MRAGRLPLDEQVTQFEAALQLNHTLTGVLARAAALALPGWYLVAGCLYQTVWNVVTGQPPEAGILDYDLAYLDGSDLSWGAEDVVIRAGQAVFEGLTVPVQIRNQARAPPGLPGQDRALAAAMAQPDGPALASERRAVDAVFRCTRMSSPLTVLRAITRQARHA
jgi:Nucleotidyltransferase